MEIEKREDMRSVFVKDMKRSTNKLRSYLQNLSQEDRIHLWQTLDIEYNLKDGAKSIEDLVTYVKSGYPKTNEKEKEKTMQTIEDSYQTIENPKDKPFTIEPKYADKYPAMGTNTYAKTKESIKIHGMRNPITVNPKNIIIDGHHRYKIWKELFSEGVKTPLKYQVKVFKTDDEIEAFLKDMNEHRRHLEKIEAAFEAAKEYVEKKETGIKTSLRDLAKKHDVSPAMIHAAKTVDAAKDPEIKEQVEKGKVNVVEAATKIKEDKKVAKIDAAITGALPKPVKIKPVKINPVVVAYNTAIDVFLGILTEKYDCGHDDLKASMDEYEKEYIEKLHKFAQYEEK